MRRNRGRAALAAALAACLILGSPGRAAELPLLPGIARTDRRIVLDADAAPWDAIARVQTNTGSRCTGVLIAPAILLTAAHCLYNRLTGTLLRPGSVHVLFGYQRGHYLLHRLVRDYAVGAGFYGRIRRPQPGDWARLRLAGAIPPRVAPLPMSRDIVVPGLPVVLAGYNQDRAELLMADPSCRITGVERSAGGVFLVHDCDATRGTSGAPLLARHDGGWRVVGINIAAGSRTNLALVPSPAP